MHRHADSLLIPQEYPTTAAFSILTKVLDEYVAEAGEGWQKVEADSQAANGILQPALIKYQDHTQADKLSKIQKDLDETKIILHQVGREDQMEMLDEIDKGNSQLMSTPDFLSQTIDSVLKRGEKLDTLVDKSNDLSLASQMFYKQAKKTNSCCTYM